MKVVYWSSTGNTERMAQMLGEELEKLGGSAKVQDVSSASPSDLEGEAVFALGCSAMGDEELDEGEMEPFVQEVEKFASGKKIGLFGSYDWGDGQWMRDWADRCRAAGADLANEGVIANLSPNDAEAEDCRKLGELMCS